MAEKRARQPMDMFTYLGLSICVKITALLTTNMCLMCVSVNFKVLKTN